MAHKESPGDWLTWLNPANPSEQAICWPVHGASASLGVSSCSDR